MKPPLVLVVLLFAACELAEVSQPDGRKLVVVQGIMRPDLAQQWILVEETLTGADVRQSTPGALPPDRPQLPVAGALVTVDNVTHTADPCGHPVVFDRQPQQPGQFAVDGVYWAPPGCPTLRPGDSVTLRVETTEGAVVTGFTRVTGAAGFSLWSATDSVDLPAAIFDFNRDRDTLVALVSGPVGRALQVDIRQANAETGFGAGADPVTSLFVDSVAVTVPGTLSDVFSGNTGLFVFHPGRQYEIGLAFADRHYFDFVRSGNGPITGSGFINHLDGGIGVFGSVVAARTPIRVIGDQDDVREGRYRARGTIDGVAIDTEWDVYLLRSTRDSVSASAFVNGDWLHGPLDGTTGLADGFFLGDDFEFVLEQEERDELMPQVYMLHRYQVRGSYQPGSFTLRVFDRSLPIGTLTVTR